MLMSISLLIFFNAFEGCVIPFSSQKRSLPQADEEGLKGLRRRGRQIALTSPSLACGAGEEGWCENKQALVH